MQQSSPNFATLNSNIFLPPITFCTDLVRGDFPTLHGQTGVSWGCSAGRRAHAWHRGGRAWEDGFRRGRGWDHFRVASPGWAASELRAPEKSLESEDVDAAWTQSLAERPVPTKQRSHRSAQVRGEATETPPPVAGTEKNPRVYAAPPAPAALRGTARCPGGVRDGQLRLLSMERHVSPARLHVGLSSGAAECISRPAHDPAVSSA